MDDFLATLVPESIQSLKAYHVPPSPPRIRLDANESPWPLPLEAREKLAVLISELPFHRYPDAHGTAVRGAIAEWTGAKKDWLTFGTGSDEIIGSILTAFSKEKPGNKKPCVLFPTPTFSMYKIIGQARGFETIGVPLDKDWDLNLSVMQREIEKHKPNVVFIASPNNPTGNRVNESKLKSLIESFEQTFFVLDEAYVAFAEKSFSDWVLQHPNLGVLGTLSKIGLAGIRVGWLHAQKPIIDVLEKVRLPFNLTMPSQMIAYFALTELKPTIEKQISKVVQERKRLGEALKKMENLNVFPSQANFWFAEVIQGTSQELQKVLEEHEIRIRAFHENPQLDKFVRITVGTPSENDELISVLKTIP